MFARHRQDRSRLVLAAVIGGLLWSYMATPLWAQTDEPDPATQLYVNGFGVAYAHVGGPRRQPVAFVDIVDGDGQPVNGALVVGNWSGCFKQLNDSSVTETVCWTGEDGAIICQDGQAAIWANKSYSCWGSGKHCSFTFTITNISKDWMTYVPVGGNTSASIPCN